MMCVVSGNDIDSMNGIGVLWEFVWSVFRCVWSLFGVYLEFNKSCVVLLSVMHSSDGVFS